MNPHLLRGRSSLTARPNILLLLSDQHRADAMGCAGDEVIQTPNLDRLAEEGVRFDRAYCTSPLCMPSRASLTTGLYPHNHGVLDNATGNLLPVMPTFMRSLQRAGYHTAGIGKFHYMLHHNIKDIEELHERMLAFGFDELLETEGKEVSEIHQGPWTRHLARSGLEHTHRDDFRVRRTQHPAWYSAPSPLGEEHHHDAFISDQTVRWIDDYRGDRPFFLWTGWVGPHLPWDPPGRFASMYDPAQFRAPPRDDPAQMPRSVRQKVERFDLARASERDLAAMSAAYYGLISHVDWHIGRIVEALEQRGILENTVIIYSTDHGEMLGEHGLVQKSVFYEPAIRVPLIVRYPARFSPGASQAFAELHDLAPTMLELARAEPLRTCEGQSLVPLLEQPDRTPEGWRDCVYSELKGEHMIRTERFKYTFRLGEQRQELFDLARDPRELRNLSGDPSLAVIERELHDRLMTWLVQTNRPLNSGDLQPGTLDGYRSEEIQPLLT
ncbi:MAG: sulfatase-like hydrolase/transferase [Chloroflexota bacterium]